MHNKSAIAWAISHWNGGIYVETVCSTRRAALETFEKLYGEKAECGRYAPNKAIKVEVRPVLKKPRHG